MSMGNDINAKQKKIIFLNQFLCYKKSLKMKDDLSKLQNIQGLHQRQKNISALIYHIYFLNGTILKVFVIEIYTNFLGAVIQMIL